jgi:pimeloyl-ACP methyl ester carboxylesterase
METPFGLISIDAEREPRIMFERDDVYRKLSDSDGAPAKPTGATSAEFVTEMFEYDGGRQVTVYVPPVPPEAIVFAGDGQGISKWGRWLEKDVVPSTMIVGVHGLTDEMLRLHEYSPGFEPERFAAHEKFFVQDVRRWTESRFGVSLRAERTAVFGVSAGGELALALGLRHPHVYGAVFCASPGGGYSRLALCRVRFRAHTLSLAHRSRSFSRTQGGGRPRCAMQMRMSS